MSGANPIVETVISLGTSLQSLITGNSSSKKDEQVLYGVSFFENDPEALGGVGGKTWVLSDRKNASITFEVIAQKSWGDPSLLPA